MMSDIYRQGATITLNFGTAGAASTASAPLGDYCRVVRLVASEDVFLKLFTATAASAATASSADMFLPADKPELFRVAGGERIICVGNATAAGFLNVTEMTR